MPKPSVRVVVSLALAFSVSGCATSPTPAPITEVVYLQHAESSSVQPRLRELNDGNTDGKLIVAAHPEANAILLSGSAALMVQAKDLITTLDQPGRQ